VTSPYHTRRALATFQHVFDGTGVAVGIEGAHDTSPARPAQWLFAPYDRAYVAYEWEAIVYYRWKYGVPFGHPVEASGPKAQGWAGNEASDSEA
jgi:hypothetical protein